MDDRSIAPLFFPYGLFTCNDRITCYRPCSYRVHHTRKEALSLLPMSRHLVKYLIAYRAGRSTVIAIACIIAPNATSVNGRIDVHESHARPDASITQIANNSTARTKL